MFLKKLIAQEIIMKKSYPYILTIGSLIGLVASFLLLIETITLTKNPTADLPCNINPFVSCTNAINSSQGAIFGFPNPILGIIAFSMLLTIGIAMFFDTKPNKNFWLILNLALLAKVLLVIWFFYQSVYVLGTLCIFCMVVWSVSWPLFLYTTIWNYLEGSFPKSALDPFYLFIIKNHIIILTTWYILIAFLILFQFKDFFLVIN